MGGIGCDFKWGYQERPYERDTHLSKDLGGEKFQAKETASANVLRQERVYKGESSTRLSKR